MFPSCTIYRAKAEVDMCSENFQKNSGCRGNPEKKKKNINCSQERIIETKYKNLKLYFVLVAVK